MLMDEPQAGVLPETRGENFYAADRSLRDLLSIYLPDAKHLHLEPHFMQLGGLVGNELDDLAAMADRNPPVLHVRDRQGRDSGLVEKHPAYREMERLACLLDEPGLVADSTFGS